MPTDKERADELEAILLAMGPSTHRVETVVLPALMQECKKLFTENRVNEAEALEAQITRIEQQIRTNNTALNTVERELYALRNKLARRQDREPT